MRHRVRGGGRSTLPAVVAGGVRALLFLLVPAAALAQGAAGSVEVGIGAGRFLGGSLAQGTTPVFDAGVKVDHESVGGFWLTGQLSRDWGVEFSYRRTATQIVEHGSGLFPTERALAGLDFATIEVLAVRSFRHGNFIPYLGGGVGLANMDIDVADPSVRDSTRGCLSVSGGARFYFARWAGIRVDVRGRGTYLGARGQGQDHGFLDTGRWFFDAEFMGGVFASFGGT